MNEENSYNLVDELWIPVLMQDGTNMRVSLGEVFADETGSIADLALNPYERIAVFRLLLCIAQAALGTKQLKNETDWKAAKNAVGIAGTDYLKKWHDRFFLYGRRAFLQPECISLIKEDGATSCEKMIIRLSSGNKSTLYDHEAVGNARRLSNADLALGFIVYQNFSSGGLSGQCIWDGIPTEKSIQGAPCRERSMLLTIAEGSYLLETVWLNLITDDLSRHSLKTEWGRPFWEFDTLSRTETAGNEKTLLGRLVPLSRAIKLTRDNPVCILGEGLSYPQIPASREPMASVKLQKGAKKNEFSETYVSSNPARMPWRELACILSLRETEGRKAALAIRHLASLPDEKEFTLWTGGLYSEKAKEVDTVEWKVRLSVGLLEENAMARYQEAITMADRQRISLYFATAEYARVMFVDDESCFSVPAERIFWDILAQADQQKLVQGVESKTYLEDWRNAIRSAAEYAYRWACPSTTARQMEAYAQGLSKLFVPDDSQKPGTSNQIKETT